MHVFLAISKVVPFFFVWNISPMMKKFQQHNPASIKLHTVK